MYACGPTVGSSQTTSHQDFKCNLCLFFLLKNHIKLPCAEGKPTKKNTANNSKSVFIFSLGEIRLLHTRKPFSCLVDLTCPFSKTDQYQY